MDLKPKFKLVIAGSRSFANFELMTKRCDFFLKDKTLSHDIVIISGTAQGADQLGERYARLRNFGLERFPADWNIGKQAGMIRNMQMLNHAHAVVVFWDGSSRGSLHMMDITRKAAKPLRVVTGS